MFQGKRGCSVLGQHELTEHSLTARNPRLERSACTSREMGLWERRLKTKKIYHAKATTNTNYPASCSEGKYNNCYFVIGQSHKKGVQPVPSYYYATMINCCFILCTWWVEIFFFFFFYLLTRSPVSPVRFVKCNKRIPRSRDSYPS